MPDQEQEMKLAEIQSEVRTHHSHGNYADALTSAQTLLKLSQDHFGRDHPSTASAFNNVGLMHKLLGNYSDARTMYHNALRIYGEVLGKDHASYAAALHNVAVLNTSQCHLDESLTFTQRATLNEEALDYVEEAWQIRVKELGSSHPHTQASQSHLGSTLADMVVQKASRVDKITTLTQQQWQKAEHHLRQAMSDAIDSPRGPTITDVEQPITTLYAASAAQALAVFLKSKGTASQKNDDEILAESKALYEQVLVVRNQLLDPVHPDTVATKFSLAELLEAVGQEEEANKIRQELIDTYGVEEIEDEKASPDSENNN